jgi:hypothetical protein
MPSRLSSASSHRRVPEPGLRLMKRRPARARSDAFSDSLRVARRDHESLHAMGQGDYFHVAVGEETADVGDVVIAVFIAQVGAAELTQSLA